MYSYDQEICQNSDENNNDNENNQSQQKKGSCSPIDYFKGYAKGCVAGGAIGLFSGGVTGAIQGCVIGGTTEAVMRGLDCMESSFNPTHN